MPRLKTLRLTSPGLLLIAAIAAAGGIAMLDVFYLQPQVEEQKWGALREQAARAEHAVQLGLQGEQSSLLGAAASWVDHSEVRRFLDPAGGAEGFRAFAERALARTDAELAWLTTGRGGRVAAWAKEPRAGGTEAVLSALPVGLGPYRASGLMPLPDGVAIYARQDVPGTGGGPPAGQLWLAKYLGRSTLNRMGSAIGGELAVVFATELPAGTVSEDATARTLWTGRNETLTVAWPICDASAKMFAYFRANLSMTSSFRHAVTARKMVLVVLTLSVGLTLLVIVGVHILIAGPVVRLLTRLGQIQAGQKPAEDLTRALHGEPLLLARHLESAFDKLAVLSKTDELTGLANRRYFEQVLEAFYNQARRYNRPLSLMIIDIDFFKDINDTGGHRVGDEALKAVGAALEEACRKADLPARIGGDEFCVLSPETTAPDAAGVAERIRATIARHIVNVKSVKLNLTVSIGITDLNACAIDSGDAMMAVADDALYVAKKLGRNQVVQAHDVLGGPQAGRSEENSAVVEIKGRLAGLDNKFKDAFLRGVEELLDVLAERNPNMVNHSRMVRKYAVLITREMELPSRIIKRIEVAAMFHDLGMFALPDAVAVFPESLDLEQSAAVRRHPLLSVRIMEGMEFLEQEVPTVRYHHERYDGSGYPDGISGATIPLTARILAVADAFDAITSPRTFRDARELQEAVKEIKHAAGRQFDPVVVDAFLAVVARSGMDILTPPEPVARGIPAAPPAEVPAPAGP